jgi:hypothetical protein
LLFCSSTKTTSIPHSHPIALIKSHCSLQANSLQFEFLPTLILPGQALSLRYWPSNPYNKPNVSVLYVKLTC